MAERAWGEVPSDDPYEMNQQTRGRPLTDREITEKVADWQTPARHGTASLPVEIANDLHERLAGVGGSLERPKDGGALAEVADLRASLSLRYEADMRAIRRWQAAHPGNDLVWPDHADLVVWLLGAADKARDPATEQESRLRDHMQRLRPRGTDGPEPAPKRRPHDWECDTEGDDCNKPPRSCACWCHAGAVPALQATGEPTDE